MRKAKYLLIVLFVAIGLLLISNSVDAATLSSRDVYSNNGSMKFNFSDLDLDMTHEYEFGFTNTSATEVETWHLITDYTETTATIDINTGTSDLKTVFNTSDIGYIRIKDKTADEIVMEPYKVDLKVPYLNVADKLVLKNGQDLTDESNYINIPLRNAKTNAYYQYEKITDQNLINKYKEIKANNGDYKELESLIKKEAPTTGWTEWDYFNGYFNDEAGFGKPEDNISVPNTGLYYMWIYFSGNNLKDIYGVIFVDNLQPDIALESVSLPKTETVELGDTITLKVTFNPSTATNKIVTWKSSNEKVATVDNNGKITPVSVGSTIITVTSEDGKKTATCTVTVTKKSSNNNNNSNNNQNNNDNINDEGKDDTTAPKPIPQTGEGITIFIVSDIVIVGIAIAYIRIKKMKDIK